MSRNNRCMNYGHPISSPVIPYRRVVRLIRHGGRYQLVHVRVYDPQRAPPIGTPARPKASHWSPYDAVTA
jgi:hypothetical protein